MSSQCPIPESANNRYMPLKLIGSGEDGIVVLSVPRSGPQNSKTSIALKLVNPEKYGVVTTTTLKKLEAMQNQDHHPLTRVLDYHPDANWYCMDFIAGYSVQQLMDTTYIEHGLPPSLVFHIFVALMELQLYLKANELCHIDLKQGGNVILSPPSNGGWPKVVLVDFGGVKAYKPGKAVEHIVGLIRTATKGNAKVPHQWRQGLNQQDLAEADEFYKTIHSFDGGPKLEELWELWEDKTKRLKQTLWVTRDRDKLLETIGMSLMREKDIQTLVDNGGMEMEVERWM